MRGAEWVFLVHISFEAFCIDPEKLHAPPFPLSPLRDTDEEVQQIRGRGWWPPMRECLPFEGGSIRGCNDGEAFSGDAGTWAGEMFAHYGISCVNAHNCDTPLDLVGKEFHGPIIFPSRCMRMCSLGESLS